MAMSAAIHISQSTQTISSRSSSTSLTRIHWFSTLHTSRHCPLTGTLNPTLNTSGCDPWKIISNVARPRRLWYYFLTWPVSDSKALLILRCKVEKSVGTTPWLHELGELYQRYSRTSFLKRAILSNSDTVLYWRFWRSPAFNSLMNKYRNYRSWWKLERKTLTEWHQTRQILAFVWRCKCACYEPNRLRLHYRISGIWPSLKSSGYLENFYHWL